MIIKTIGEELKKRYGCKVYKLALSSGCTCPNRDGSIGESGCIFCDGAGSFAMSGDIDEQIEKAKRLVSDKAGEDAVYIAYFQSYTNTYGDVDKLWRLYSQVASRDDIMILDIATRPDCITDDVMDMLSKLRTIKPVWVELGLQTIHAASAAYIRRGYELDVYDDAVDKLHAAGIDVIVHQILGIPGESVDMMKETTRYIATSGADGIKFHLLHVIEGTDLATEWREGRVRVMSFDEYSEALISCLREMPTDMIVHRLTGDGDKRTLLAPMWSADKKHVMNELHKRITNS